MWVRCGFIEGVFTNMRESTNIYRCSDQSSSYLRAKGRMTGTYSTSYLPKRTNALNMCDYRSLAVAGHRNPRYGVSTLATCLLDVDFGQNHPRTLGPRRTGVSDAWVKW
jgi:hypothetical protein